MTTKAVHATCPGRRLAIPRAAPVPLDATTTTAEATEGRVLAAFPFRGRKHLDSPIPNQARRRAQEWQRPAGPAEAAGLRPARGHLAHSRRASRYRTGNQVRQARQAQADLTRRAHARGSRTLAAWTTIDAPCSLPCSPCPRSRLRSA